MPEKTIPDVIRIASNRAFLRTMYQGYSGTLTVGLLTSVVALAVSGGDWRTTLTAVAIAVLSPPLSGLVAKFQWLGDKIPVEYGPAAFESSVQRNQKAAEAASLQGE